MAMYILGILVSFTPSLGLMNTLRHYQADRIPFANKDFCGKPKYNFSKDMLYFGNAPPVAWADITHVDYSNPADPKPPHIRS